MSYQDYDDKDQLGHIMQALGRIEGKLEGLPERVAALEKWKNWLGGAWAVIAAGFVYIWQGRK